MAALEVRKTYKLYIGGAFPRSESARSYEVTDTKGRFLANAALADGMRTLRDDGWRKVLDGRTTVDEVARVSKGDIVNNQGA